jgi:peptide/nickel transport system substrate-binding protein
MRNKKIFFLGIIIFSFLIILLSLFIFLKKESFNLLKKPKELERFILAIDSDISGFYPFGSREVLNESINFEIFSALTRLDKEGKLLPDLAEYWFNPDPLTWEIVLKKGVKFHNGRELTSRDVVFSLEELPKRIENFSRAENLIMISQIQEIDPYRLRIITKEPYSLLMYDLSNLVILSKDYIEEKGYGAPPLGSGPYKYKNYEKGKEIILERFENYYGKKPLAKEVIYKIIPEEEKRIEALINKEVDFIIQLSEEGKRKLETFPEIKIVTTPSVGITFLAMNVGETSIFKDKRVREAIGRAIDVDEIIKKVLSGRGRIATQLAVPEAFGFNFELEPFTYDLEMAKKLLKEAGFPKGFEIELLVPADEREKVAEIIAEQLALLEIKVRVKPLPRGEFFKQLSLKPPFFLLTVLDELRDVTAFSLVLYHTRKGAFGRLNLVDYSNLKVDELIEKALNPLLDLKVKQDYGKEIMRLTAKDDFPYLPLYIGSFSGASRKDINFSQRADGLIVITDLSLSK